MEAQPHMESHEITWNPFWTRVLDFGARTLPKYQGLHFTFTPSPPSKALKLEGCSGSLLLLWHVACSKPRGHWQLQSPAERRGQESGPE